MKKFFLIIVILATGLVYNATRPDTACAAIFKPSNLAACPDGAAPDYNSCPNPEGDSLTYCVRGVEFELLTTMAPASVPLPEGSKLRYEIWIEPRICPVVTCLLREDVRELTVTPEILSKLQTGQLEVQKYIQMDYIGCSGGACPRDNLNVKLTIIPPTGSQVTCVSVPNTLGKTGGNAPPGERFNVQIMCEGPEPTPVCPVPGIVPNVKVTCPNCSQ